MHLLSLQMCRYMMRKRMKWFSRLYRGNWRKMPVPDNVITLCHISKRLRQFCSEGRATNATPAITNKFKCKPGLIHPNIEYLLNIHPVHRMLWYQDPLIKHDSSPCQEHVFLSWEAEVNRTHYAAFLIDRRKTSRLQVFFFNLLKNLV